MRALLLALLLTLAAGAAIARPAPQAERIADFSSDITVAKDGGMTVKETITVHSEGREIIHGIFRDFPSRYRDKAGNEVNVRFSVREVKRDGNAESYSISSLRNGRRVRIGDADTRIPRGDHTYLIVYETDRQIGFFPEFDELYWNVTGNAWAFPIQHAEAIVHLPEGARMVSHSEYTGAFGTRGGQASAESKGVAYRFFTTAPLGRREGLSFALDFTKGAVLPPSQFRQALYFLRDNAMSGAALLGFAVLGVYFFVAWWRFGRDPKRGVIIPLFAPPRNLSAASVRFVRRMEYDGKCFAAALVSMAVKGYLKITEDFGTYVLTRAEGDERALSRPEAALALPLFGWGSTVVLRSENHALVEKAIAELKGALKREDQDVYFITNSGWFLGGLVILLCSIGGAAWFAANEDSSVFVVVWMLAWTGFFALLLRFTGGNPLNILLRLAPRLVIVLAVLAYTLTSNSIAGKALNTMSPLSGYLPLVALAALLGQACLVVAFYRLLKAPTLAGAKIRDEIDGFKMYLETAEKDRLEKLHPPAVTPELFEKFLPYAIALDAENAWARKFELEAERAGHPLDRDYAPSWYAGRSFARLGRTGFASSLGSSIASATAAAATAPGGRVGGGGGGFSGGGGGGGGGGGW